MRGGHIESLERRCLFAVPGSLDPTFSGDGKATVAGLNLSATDVAVQADGKTLVVGLADLGTNDPQAVLVRFLVDGQRDPSFGASGIVVTDVSAGTSGADTRIAAIAIAPDGKIVVAGRDEGAGNALIMRYTADGAPDTSFSDDGQTRINLANLAGETEAFDVAVQPDGKIIVVGTTYKIPNYDFFVMRLATNGALDRDVRDTVTNNLIYQGFAIDGVNTFGFGGDDEAQAVKLDNAGNVYVTGFVNNGNGNFSAGVAKLSPLGGLFNSFSSDGQTSFQVPVRTNTVAKDLIVQPDGKVVIAGYATDPANGQNDFFVARYTSLGALDTTFGEGNQGYTVTDLGGNDVAEGITATPSGGGGGFIVSGGSGGMAAVKYTENGLLDNAFGTAGKVRLLFGGTASIAPGPGRRIVLAGGADFATARLLLNGAREVNAFALDATAGEGTTNTGSILVTRTERMPFPTRVFFNIGGSATVSASRTAPRDYSMSGLAISSVITPTLATGFVDIPANETTVTLTLSTFNDSLAEGTESAIFSIAADSVYEISSPSAGTIKILDDDSHNSLVGTTTATLPPKQVGVGEELQAAVTWTVPSGGWRQLSTIELRLRDLKNGDALAILSFDEATNSFSVQSTPAGDNLVTLVPGKSTFQAAGPTAPTVTVIFTFLFNAAATNTRFAVDVAARNDTDAFSGFEQVGELHVHKKLKGDGLALAL
jgi:uncharacterized delta-60 repeat protein